jgi:hypothetical protein
LIEDACSKSKRINRNGLVRKFEHACLRAVGLPPA